MNGNIHVSGQLKALDNWRHEDGSREGFLKWLETNRQLEIFEHLLVQRELVHRLLVVQQAEFSLNLSDRLHSTIRLDDILDSLSGAGEVAVANRIAFIQDNQRTTLVIGDLHADSAALWRVLETCDFFELPVSEKPRLVFLGDYVDRGKDHLGLLDMLMGLKISYPNLIILLQGNHDGGFLESNGGVRTPYRLGDDDNWLDYFPHLLRHWEKSVAKQIAPIHMTYFNWFEALPLACVFKNGDAVCLAVHGGILRPRLDGSKAAKDYYSWVSCAADLTSNSQLDLIDRSNVQNLLWSDPADHIDMEKWQNGRFQFDHEHFNVFKDVFGFDVLFRGHVVEREGIRAFFDQKLFSVYSTGGLLTTGHNHLSAYPDVKPAVAILCKGSVIKKHL